MKDQTISHSFHCTYLCKKVTLYLSHHSLNYISYTTSNMKTKRGSNIHEYRNRNDIYVI